MTKALADHLDQIAAICARHGVARLYAFGSAVREAIAKETRRPSNPLRLRVMSAVCSTRSVVPHKKVLHDHIVGHQSEKAVDSPIRLCAGSRCHRVLDAVQMTTRY